MDLQSWKLTFIIIAFLLILSLTCAIRITVKECPVTETKWKTRSQSITCETSKAYHCIQDDMGNLIETCMIPYKVTPVREGGCPWAFYSTERGAILGGVFYSCEGIGCPQKNDSDYWTNELYKYPICLHHYNEAITDVTDYTTEFSISTSAVSETSASNEINNTAGVITAIVITAVVTSMFWIVTVLAMKYRGLKSPKHADVKSERVLLLDTDTSTRLNEMQEIYGHNTQDTFIPKRIKNLSNTLHMFRRTFLHLLCLEGKTNLVKCLISNFENQLQMKDKNGCTPFHLSGISGSVELVQYLKDKYNIYSKDDDGRTILHNACQRGHVLLVKYLIDNDEDVLNTEDKNGLTPFHCAGFSGSVELVQYLIENGCDVYSKDNAGRTIVHNACQRGNINLVKFMLKKDKSVFSIEDSKGLTPFHCTGFSGSVELVRYLIESGCDVYSKDSTGQTIVHIACGEGDLQLVKYLIGIDKDIISMKDKGGKIALYCKDKDGRTILHKACNAGHVGLVKFLLGIDKDILNEKDSFGMTPCHLAGYSGSIELVQYLCGNGFDMYSTDNDGQMIIHKACDMGHFNLVRYLVSKDNEILKRKERNDATPFHYAGFSGSVELVQYLIYYGCNIYDMDKTGWTIVHYACRKGHANLVKHLIDEDKGLLKIKDKNGLTPFHLAGFSGSIELIEYLLDKGSNLHSKDFHGRTILHNACSEGHLNVMNYLTGCDGSIIHIKDNSAQTPLKLACKYFENT